MDSQVIGERLPVHGEEGQRVRETEGPKARLEFGGACPRIATATASARRCRGVPIIEIDPLQPDHATAQGAKAQRPLKVDPEAAATVRVSNRIRRPKEDGKAYPIAIGTGLHMPAVLRQVRRRIREAFLARVCCTCR